MNFIEGYRSKWIEELPFPVRKYGSRNIGFGFKIGSHETHRDQQEQWRWARRFAITAPPSAASGTRSDWPRRRQSGPTGPEPPHAVPAVLAFPLRLQNAHRDHGINSPTPRGPVLDGQRSHNVNARSIDSPLSGDSLVCLSGR